MADKWKKARVASMLKAHAEITTAPASTSKKKSNAIAYHFIREGVAQDEWWTAYVNMDENLADLLTTPLSGPKRAKFV